MPISHPTTTTNNKKAPSHPPKLRTPPYDPWNSSSTGHQRAENRLSGSTSWRDSRTFKLAAQLSDIAGTGGQRLYDLVGAGSERFGQDGRLENGGWERGALGLRVKEGCRDVGEMMALNSSAGEGQKKEGLEERNEDEGQSWEGQKQVNDERKDPAVADDDDEERRTRRNEGYDFEDDEEGKGKKVTKKKQHLFTGCAIYINGSTYPHISDHKLKHLLVQHGARLSIALGRRTVTHVIVGQPNAPSTSSSTSKSLSHSHSHSHSRSINVVRGGGVGGGGGGGGRGGGAGGGLSASKIQKEISLVRGASGVKYVSVEWVLECLRLGTRVSEARFRVVDTAPCGVKSVVGMFERQRRKEEVKGGKEGEDRMVIGEG